MLGELAYTTSASERGCGVELREKTCDVGNMLNQQFLHHTDRVRRRLIVAEAVHHRRHYLARSAQTGANAIEKTHNLSQRDPS